MEAGLLKTLGETLGIGGVALGVFLPLFGEMIRKSRPPRSGLSRSDFVPWRERDLGECPL